MNENQSNTETRPHISLRKRIIFGLIVTVAFFAALELGFRGLELVKPPRHVDYGLGFDEGSRVFVESSLYPGEMETDRAKRVSFVRQRFDRVKPDDTFRIVALGGSSVNYLEPEFRALEEELTEEYQEQFGKVEIINCGGFAYGSHRLVVVFREVLNYSPDLILLYSGHNEFEEVEQMQLSNLDQLSFDRAISKSAIVRFIRDRKADYKISQLEKEHNRRLLASEEPVSESNFARAWTHPFTQADVKQRMGQFEHNLRLILALAREEKVPVIVGTVSSNLLRPYLPQAAAARYEQVYQLWTEGRAEEGLTMAREILRETPGRHQSSDLENRILRKLADEFSLPIVDVEANVVENEPLGIPGETLFDDHCHLNAAGRAVWIATFEPEIRRLLETRGKNQ